MTKEKAIDLLDNLIGMVEDNHNSDYDTALKIGIKELKKEPCGDCVSRKAVDLLCFRFLKANSDDNVAFYEHFLDLPPVAPVRKKGHWILKDVEGNRIWKCECSKCRKDPQDFIGGSENWWLIKNKLPKFCPNCGSDNSIERSLCDSCVTKGCILQTGIIRNHCDFYKSGSEE